MAILNDIQCFWDMSGRHRFYDKHMWKGKFLLEEDGWFEGIVKGENSPYPGESIIFGFYNPTKSIELYKVSPADMCDPYVFRGKKDDLGYEGDFSALGYIEETPYGFSHMIIQDMEDLKRRGFISISEMEIESEKEDLMKRIADFKKENDFRELYMNVLSMRKQMLGKQTARDPYLKDTTYGIRKLLMEMEPSFFEDSEELSFQNQKV